MELNKLLRPQKIVIVGATERETMAGFASRMFLEQCRERMEDLYLVSLKNDRVFGVPCYRKISDIPGKIDLAVICTPKTTVPALLEEAAEQGAKGAVVFASGYGETKLPEDVRMEEELTAKAKDLDIAVMGPNCAGFLNFVDRVFAFGFLFQARESAGKIGLVSQSGQVCMGLMESAKGSFSYVISAGNSKIVTMEDYLEFLVEDENTEVVAAYMEGIKKPEKFAQVLHRAVEKRKPVVILKAGRSQKGSRAAASHTGNLSGCDKHTDALFKKFGVIRVEDLEELLSVCAAIVTLPKLPEKNSLAFVNISGGETTISADAGSLYGLELPDFSKETTERLKRVLPPFATAQNPMDLTGGSDGNTFEQVAEIVMEDPQVEMLVTSLQITEKISDITIYDYLEGLIRYCIRHPEKPAAVVPLIESGREKEVLEKLRAAGVPILPPPHYGYRVIRHLMDYTAFLKTAENRTGTIAALQNKQEEDRIALSEHQSKQIFIDYGIPCPKEKLTVTWKEAAVCAAEMGKKVVLKIESNDILHKSEIGGVRVGIQGEQEIKNAFQGIMERAEQERPDAKINGILVQEMLEEGLEMMIGVTCDPNLGPMILLGMGGIFTEIFQDAVLYPAPINHWEAEEMISSLKSSRLLAGYRGQPPLDIKALADCLVSVSRLAEDYREKLVEMDINPVFVYPEGKGVKAADGLMVLCRKP